MPCRHRRFDAIFPIALIISAAFMALGLLIEGPEAALRGLLDIIRRPDLLITDYTETSGLGAALLNAGLVTAASAAVLKLSRDPFNGYSVVTLSLMLGFGFFGKNILTMWPFVIGGLLYSRLSHREFANYAAVSLMSSSLSPLISYISMGTDHPSLILGFAVGVVIGILMPALCPYTYRIQNGMNLYNTGFAAGLLAMVIVPVITSAGGGLSTALHWNEGFDPWLLAILVSLSLLCLLAGLFFCRSPLREVLAEYLQLLGTTGRTPCDYLRMFGYAPTLVNMGVNGLFCLAFLYFAGGDLNGPTCGAIITIMGFSAWGKHVRNMLPVMLGVALGATLLDFSTEDPAIQIALLFVTTLAPIAGHFGWPIGLLAGFSHSALVLQTAGPVSGLNLYNNGFSGGLIAIVIIPVAAAIFNHHLPKLRDASFFEVLEDDLITEEEWDTSETEYMRPRSRREGDAHEFEHEPEHHFKDE